MPADHWVHPQPEALRESARVKLGLPAEGTYERVVVPGERIGLMYRGYTLELIGRRFGTRFRDESPDGPTSPRGWPPDPPRIDVFGTIIGFPRLELLLMTVTIRGSAASLRWRWGPTTGEEPAVVIGQPESKNLAAKFRLARQFIDEAMHPGAPLGNTYITDDNFREALANTLEKHRRDTRHAPTRLKIGLGTGYRDLKSFDARLDRLNIRWPEVKSGQWLATWRSVHPK